MDTIDISQNIHDFKQVFENESRIIFSARFGDGKSYFLKEFMKNFILLCIHEPLRKSRWLCSSSVCIHFIEIINKNEMYDGKK